VTTEIVNSPVFLIFRNVCFGVPSTPRNAGEKATTGGLVPKALKKEKGARFGRPCSSSVPTKAIGRGATKFNR